MFTNATFLASFPERQIFAIMDLCTQIEPIQKQILRQNQHTVKPILNQTQVLPSQIHLRLTMEIIYYLINSCTVPARSGKDLALLPQRREFS